MVVWHDLLQCLLVCEVTVGGGWHWDQRRLLEGKSWERWWVDVEEGMEVC